jgi:hypothetical protein
MSVGEIIFWATASYPASAVLRVNWRVIWGRTRRVIKPFHLHRTVTPIISANTTHMHRCQRSSLASTAIHTIYSAVSKENSWSSISYPLARSHRTCITYTWCCMFSLLDFWWWTERPSETCRVLFQNKINFRYCASSWFYYRNILNL